MIDPTYEQARDAAAEEYASSLTTKIAAEGFSTQRPNGQWVSRANAFEAGADWADAREDIILNEAADKYLSCAVKLNDAADRLATQSATIAALEEALGQILAQRFAADNQSREPQIYKIALEALTKIRAAKAKEE